LDYHQERNTFSPGAMWLPQARCTWGRIGPGSESSVFSHFGEFEVSLVSFVKKKKVSLVRVKLIIIG
jgi:hypothetical protein